MHIDDLDMASISPKTLLLIETLVSEMKENSIGIVFVQTKASVALLYVLLSIHPQTKDLLKVGTFIGTSNHQSRKSRLGDWTPRADQSDVLQELRDGTKNLIIATSVLEEGIDITACNVVVCFERPANLKSLIQRRGRARHKKSKYIIMFSEYERNLADEWKTMEEIMKQYYADALREIQELRALEETEEGYRELSIPETGSETTPL